ncbi:MAG: membrane protein insertase YidC [Candidatus Paracaedimonas acanthamoebae]|uniref:Membrane protein insertase YidC n=1 Tax=Candidatus Paracaedimonas acanthamoebae TaxID=244581 RepID=A0A8J7TUZ7_9PROT|nr:membrane protein insertase YidC [Candidatus Paracaedimonas acanthamoebae]
MDNQDKRNLYLMVIVTTVVLFGWSYFFEKPRQVERQQVQTTTVSSQTNIPSIESAKPLVREEALKQTKRILVETPTLKGSLNLQGLKLDDVTLKNYRETPEEESSQVSLFNPMGSKAPYYGEFGWVSDKKTVKLPDADTIWIANQTLLTPEQPVKLHWDNGEGLRFEIDITVDKNYLFSITQRVFNHMKDPIVIQPYGLISRHGLPQTSGFMILHEGPLGYLNNKLQEIEYKDLTKGDQSQLSQGGWLGFTDKYWLAAFIPDQVQEVKASFRQVGQVSQERYQVDFLMTTSVLQPGTTQETKSSLFVGAKILDLLDSYENTLNVKHFDLAVDFGWFYFLTKPIFHILTFAHQWLGNFGLAIMLLTVLLKLLMFPLANKSYRSMAQMKRLTPQITRLREKYGDDKLRVNQEMMALYKKEKVNPMAGCLPMIVQIPVFFALYKVLFVSIEMRQAPFYGWIHDLSAPDPTSLFNLFGLLPWSLPSYLMIGLWPLLMGLSMFVQQKLNPPPSDPAQAKVFMIMPVMFTFMLAQFPAGLVIYWTWSNLLTILQQWTMMTLHDKDEKNKVLIKKK